MPQSWFRTESGQSLGCLLPEDGLVLQPGRPPRLLVDVLPPEYDASAWLPELFPLLCPLALGKGAPHRMLTGQEDARCRCTESLRSHKPQ